MAEAKKSPSADPWPAEGLTLAEACQEIMPDLWHVYVEAPTRTSRSGEVDSSQKDAARSAIEAELSRRMEDGYELWGCRDQATEPERVWTLQGLRLNLEELTAKGEGGLKLCDLRLRQVGMRKVVQPAPVEKSREQPKRKVGRKPQFDWDAIHAEFSRRVYDDGLPDNVSEFTRNLLEWCGTHFGLDYTPDFETAYDYVMKWIAAWHRSLQPPT
jgi:hypothetical protein